MADRKKIQNMDDTFALCSAVRSIYFPFQSLNYFNYDIGEGHDSLKIPIYLIVEYIFTGLVYVHNIKQENIKALYALNKEI